MKIRLPGSTPVQANDDWVRGLEQFKSDETRLVAWRIRYQSDTWVKVALALASAVSAIGLAIFAWMVRQGTL